MISATNKDRSMGSRSFGSWWSGVLLTVVFGLSFTGLGLLLAFDRPGLKADYFALDPDWRSASVFSDIDYPEIASRGTLAGRLVSREIFSIRWRGWIEIDKTADVKFRIRSDGGFYLKIDNELMIGIEEGVGRRQRRFQGPLDKGLHPIEIGFSQTGGPAGLRLRWARSDQNWSPIPSDSLFVSRPSATRIRVRKAFGWMGAATRRMLGALLVVIGLAPILALVTRRHQYGKPKFQNLGSIAEVFTQNRGFQIVVILLAALGVWWLVYPYTGSTVDGDDVRYLYAAAFAKKMGWIVNRYAHVYLLRAFMTLQGGEVFLGSRLYWAFMFAVTFGSLAVATRSLGRGLQVRTLAITLFLLLSQASLFGGIGAAYADYTVMMYSEIRWHAFAIGALTVGAIKSKETGLIMLWLPLLFAWWRGLFDLRRFLRTMLFWIGGGITAYLILMIVDAYVLGDFWFSLRPETLAGLDRLHGASEGKSKWDSLVWFEVVWAGTPRLAPTIFSLRHLGFLVMISAAFTFAKTKDIEARLLHLMPIAYLLMMIAIHPAFFSTRFLMPMIPVSCLLGAMVFVNTGLENLPWGRLARPMFVTPIVLVASFVCFVVVPLRAEGFLTPEPVVLHADLATVLSVASVVGLVTVCGALIWLRGQTRLAVLLVCLVAFFGPGFHLTQSGLHRKLSVQRGNLILYPWVAFEDQIVSIRPRRLTISQDVVRRYGMTGQRITRNRLARMYFRRIHLKVAETRTLHSDLECVIGDLETYETWLNQAPELVEAAVSDGSGQFRLISPQNLDRSSD
jgi:hypothetical protein